MEHCTQLFFAASLFPIILLNVSHGVYCVQRIDGDIQRLRSLFVNAASVILRGVNDFEFDEMERSLHDVLCVTKRTLESNAVVPSGGCVEAAVIYTWRSLRLLCEIDRDLPDGYDLMMRMDPPIKPMHRHVMLHIFRSPRVHSAPRRVDWHVVIQVPGNKLVSLHSLTLTFPPVSPSPLLAQPNQMGFAPLAISDQYASHSPFSSHRACPPQFSTGRPDIQYTIQPRLLFRNHKQIELLQPTPHFLAIHPLLVVQPAQSVSQSVH